MPESTSKHLTILLRMILILLLTDWVDALQFSDSFAHRPTTFSNSPMRTPACGIVTPTQTSVQRRQLLRENTNIGALLDRQLSTDLKRYALSFCRFGPLSIFSPRSERTGSMQIARNFQYVPHGNSMCGFAHARRRVKFSTHRRHRGTQ